MRNWYRRHPRLTLGLIALVIAAGCTANQQTQTNPGDPCPTVNKTQLGSDGHTYTCLQNNRGKLTWGGYN